MGYRRGIYWTGGLSAQVGLSRDYFDLQGQMNTGGIAKTIEGWYMVEAGQGRNTPLNQGAEYTGRAKWYVVVMRPGDDKPRHFSEATYRKNDSDPFQQRPSYRGSQGRRVMAGNDITYQRPPSYLLAEMQGMYEEAKSDSDALLNALVITTPEQVKAQVVAKLSGMTYDLSSMAGEMQEKLMKGWTEMLMKAWGENEGHVTFSTEIDSVALSFYSVAYNNGLHYSGKLPSLFVNRFAVHAQVEKWCRMMRVE